MKAFRQWVWILIALGALFLAFTFGQKFKWPEKQRSEDSVVLLEEIRKVCKLVTAEGQFAEIYEYKETLPFAKPFFDKKALIRVRAKVSVGYDLADLRIFPDEASKTLTVENLPEAEIISVEHDLDYYDLTEGFFNRFSEGDYNRMNANAKEFLVAQVRKSSLMQAADEKRDELLDVIRYMAQQSGWSVIVLNTETLQQ